MVTGGSYGIGAAISERLAADGCEVIVTGRHLDKAKLVADRIGGRAVAFDVAEHADAQAAVRACGPIDILVNNAGWDHFGWFTDVEVETWKRILAVNLEGVISVTQAALPAMQENGWGRVITIGSEGWRVGNKGNAVYAAAKGAVVSLMQALAQENARFNITCNVVSPGPIDTPLLHEMPEKAIEAARNMTQFKRLGTAEECAAAVSFIASEGASFITGETLGVGGGMHLG